MAAVKSSYHRVPAFVTKDGSIIRELMHPNVHGNHKQSLAEATIPVGAVTMLHSHGHTEEIYHITSGKGLMTLGEERFEVVVGDTVCIPPGTPHSIENIAEVPVILLCSCTPPYSDQDTQLLEPVRA